MKVAVDSSILVAALLPHEDGHQACVALLEQSSHVTAWPHVMSETFSSLTGGRHGWRAKPNQASQLIDDLLPQLSFTELTATDKSAALREAHLVGVRGGAIYDYLHLVAAKKAGAEAFYTLNSRHFAAVARAGDPHILSPESSL